MSQEQRDALILLVMILITLILMGSAVLAALMIAWRNYNRRQKLLDKGKRLRAEFRGDIPPPEPSAWHQSGQRLQSDDRADGDEKPDEDPPDDDPDRPQNNPRP